MTARPGPCLETWESAVVDSKPLPPLQPHEHMTVGQVRHPELQPVFIEEFQKWFSSTKKEMDVAYKKATSQQEVKGKVRSKVRRRAKGSGRGRKAAQDTYNDDDVAQSWLVSCSETADAALLKCEIRQAVEDQVAASLGWDKITCKQLRQLLARYKNGSDALQQLLVSSYRLRREQQRKQVATSAGAATAADSPDAQCHADAEGSAAYYADSDVDEDHLEDEHAWFSLKTDIPVNQCVQAGIVPEGDARTPLVGAHGIWATKDVPAGHVLGPYRHYCMFNNTYNQWLLETPKHGWKEPPSTWKLALESYACNDEVGVLQDKEFNSYSFVYSGWGYGNYTGYANDPHIDPIGNLFAERQPDGYLGPLVKGEDGQELHGNTKCVVVRILGWPYLFMITTDPVGKAQEFLYEYGHAYWVLVAKVLREAQTEMELLKKEEEQAELKKQKLELEKKLEQMRRQQESQATSGLTTSLQCPSGLEAAPTTSAAGPAAVTSPAGGGRPAAAASGLTSIGQRLQGMRLISATRQQQHNRQLLAGMSHLQLPDQQQQQLEGVGESPAGPSKTLSPVTAATTHQPKASAAGGASIAAAYDADSEDEASSAYPQSLRAYRNRPLFRDERQQRRLYESVERVKRQQLRMRFKGHDGVERDMQRISDPKIAEMIRDTEMKLFRTLYCFPSGLSYNKLPAGWWHSDMAQYEYDQWEFIRRRPLFFECGSVNSPNTTIRLTDEWRRELEPLAKHERWRRPDKQFAGSGGRKRVRQEVVMVENPQLQAELQHKKQKLQAAEAEQQQLIKLVQSQQAVLLELQAFLQQRRVQLPPALQHRLQGTLQAHNNQTAAGMHGSHPSPASPAAGGVGTAPKPSCGLVATGFKGAPIPGGDDDSDADDSGYEDEPDQQEPSDDHHDAADSDDDARRPAAAGPAHTAAGPGRVGSGRGAPAVRGGSSSRPDSRLLYPQQQGPRVPCQRPVLQQSSGGQQGTYHGGRAGDMRYGGHQRQHRGVGQERQTNNFVGQKHDHRQQLGHFDLQQLGSAGQQAGHQLHSREGQYGLRDARAEAGGQQHQSAERQRQWVDGSRQQGLPDYHGVWQQRGQHH